MVKSIPVRQQVWGDGCGKGKNATASAYGSSEKYGISGSKQLSWQARDHVEER